MSGFELRNLRFAFAGGPSVLDGFDLDVEAARICAIVGSSGCGKSTLLRIIAGLLHPASGEVGLPEASVRTAIMFQAPRLLPWLTARANVALGLEYGDEVRHDPRRIDELLSLVGLASHTDKFPRELSGGMAQRVALARTLACDPALILMDEPFAALDYLTRRRLAREVRDILRRRGVTAVLVTHDIDEALTMADAVAVMGDKRIRARFDLKPTEKRDVSRIDAYRTEILELLGEAP